MNALNVEIDNLIARLAGLSPSSRSVEGRALALLRRIAEAGAPLHPRDHPSHLYGELHEFWASTVPWCSSLSRDLERIIIMYRDLSQETPET